MAPSTSRAVRTAVFDELRAENVDRAVMPCAIALRAPCERFAEIRPICVSPSPGCPTPRPVAAADQTLQAVDDGIRTALGGRTLRDLLAGPGRTGN